MQLIESAMLLLGDQINHVQLAQRALYRVNSCLVRIYWTHGPQFGLAGRLNHLVWRLLFWIELLQRASDLEAIDYGTERSLRLQKPRRYPVIHTRRPQRLVLLLSRLESGRHERLLHRSAMRV